MGDGIGMRIGMGMGVCVREADWRIELLDGKKEMRMRMDGSHTTGMKLDESHDRNEVG